MKIVAGLGNPGKRYAQTRHNVGFRVVEELARRGGSSFRRAWGAKARACKVQFAGETLLLVEPQTFMNRSGQAVAPLLRKKGVSPADLIVVVDDTELEFGTLRIRPKGSAGGHNGLKSLVASLGTEEFVRVRVGVGRDEKVADLADHVLSNFSAGERRKVDDEIVPRAADAVLAIVENGPEKAMNDFN